MRDTQSPGLVNVPINCGGVVVDPSDIVIGDNDGVVVADAETLEILLPKAKAIYEAEAKIKDLLIQGKGLAVSTNIEVHISARLAGKDSSLAFKVLFVYTIFKCNKQTMRMFPFKVKCTVVYLSYYCVGINWLCSIQIVNPRAPALSSDWLESNWFFRGRFGRMDLQLSDSPKQLSDSPK